MLNIFKSATKSTFDQMALDLVSERGNQTCRCSDSCMSQLCGSLYAIDMNLPLYRMFPPTLWQDMIWCFPDSIHVIVQSYHQVALERVASKTLSSPVLQRARPLLVPLRTTQRKRMDLGALIDETLDPGGFDLLQIDQAVTHNNGIWSSRRPSHIWRTHALSGL